MSKTYCSEHPDGCPPDYVAGDDDAGDEGDPRWYEIAIAWGCFIVAAGFIVGCALLTRACRGK